MRQWLSLTQAARELGVSRPTIYRMLNDGRLVAVEPPYFGKFMVTLESVERLKQMSSKLQSKPPAQQG